MERHELIARHEAGHALVAEAVGVTVTELQITSWGGMCRSRAPTEWRLSVAGRRRLIQIDLAGFAAEERGIDRRSSDYASARDHAAAVRARTGMPTGAILAVEEAVVRAYLARHHEQLDRLAAALAQHHRLDGDEARAILGPVEPLVAPPLPLPLPATTRRRTRRRAPKRRPPRITLRAPRVDPLAACRAVLAARAERRARERRRGARP